jgi:dCMP deaminase
MRLTWEEYALKIAFVASQRSEDPFKKVGACALDYDNRVIGVAYNGLAPGKVVSSDFWKDRESRRPFMIHAEANVLALIKRGECRILACTLLPCSSCATNIIAHGIKKVVYSENYTRDERSKDIFEFNGVECLQLNLSEEL